MKIDYLVLHRNLKITLTTGETLYGRAYPDGEESYFVYDFFTGTRRGVPAAAIRAYETFREEDLSAKVKAYEDLEKLCGEDPVFHMKVLDFALEILSEALAEKEHTKKNLVRADAEREARESLKKRGDV